jgi:hypothetical protein
MPLMWAQAEYIKLLRSTLDGVIFDLHPDVADRYLKRRGMPKPLEVWKFNNRHARAVKPGSVLRILAAAPFRLHWPRGDWQSTEDVPSIAPLSELSSLISRFRSPSTHRSALLSCGWLRTAGKGATSRSPLRTKVLTRQLRAVR